MKIIVLLKQVPDTEANIKLGEKSIVETGIKWIISPYDEFAIEEGIKIREKFNGEVIAVTVGPDRVAEALRTAYAMGVDKAIHIKVADYNTFDSTYTAKLIANYIKSENPDLIISGKQAIDTDGSLVAVQIAEILNIPHVSMVLKVEIDAKNLKVTREVEGGTAVQALSMPALLTAQKGLNEPRYPSLKGIMAAKKKAITTKTPEELGVSGSNIEVVSLEPPPPRVAGRKLEAADANGFASQLVKALREEAKVL